MSRNRETLIDYLARTDEPIDELWHQQLLDEWSEQLEQLLEETDPNEHDV